MKNRLVQFQYRGVSVFLQREDVSATGSFKDRGIWPLIEYYRKKQKNKKTKKQIRFAISSSGNAGVSAAYYCKRWGLGLDVFVGRKIPREKLMRLKNFQEGIQKKPSFRGVGMIKVHQSPTPRRDAFRFAQHTGAQLISTAVDNHCLGGYAKMVREFPKIIDAIFVPASSGALAVGLYRGYRSKGKRKKEKGKIPRFFILQTPAVHPFVAVKRGWSSKASLARAIADVVGERKYEIRNIIRESRGAGVVVIDRSVREAMRFLEKLAKEKNIRFGSTGDPSPNGSLSLAGLLQLVREGKRKKEKWKFNRVLCFYTGD